MKCFELIKTYPDSPKLGTQVALFPTRNDNCGIFYHTVAKDEGKLIPIYGEYAYGKLLIENQEEFWKEIDESEIKNI